MSGGNDSWWCYSGALVFPVPISTTPTCDPGYFCTPSCYLLRGARMRRSARALRSARAPLPPRERVLLVQAQTLWQMTA
ncbi:hypothetical protein EON66_08735 [archaeon]|nr:MAG: hypothetical protein EON66_08735 [archaeon]